MNAIDVAAARVSAAADDRSRAFAELELAILLTRAGRHSEAREIHQRHHRSQAPGATVDHSLTLILLDGLIAYFQDEDLTKAKDRVYRAFRLAVASQGCTVTDLVGAWLAHLQFNAGEHRLMAETLGAVLISARSLSAAAKLRISLTIADANALAGRFPEANCFYSSARRLAIDLSDNFSIAAISHNRSTLALSHARFEGATGLNLAESPGLFLKELLSAESLESLLSMQSVLYPYEIWRARLHMLDLNYRAAQEALASHIEGASNSSVGALAVSVWGDLGYCNAQLGNCEGAIQAIDRALSSTSIGNLPSDDSAVLFAYASHVFQSAGDTARAIDLQGRMVVFRDAFASEVAEIRECLASLPELEFVLRGA